MSLTEPTGDSNSWKNPAVINCKFCNSHDIEIRTRKYDDEKIYHVYCCGCGARSGEYGTLNDAIYHWNACVKYEVFILDENEHFVLNVFKNNYPDEVFYGAGNKGPLKIRIEWV